MTANLAGVSMANWKRLTNVENQKVDVNLDNVAYIEPQTDGAWIHFVGGRTIFLRLRELNSWTCWAVGLQD
jgi:hypothetical protein